MELKWSQFVFSVEIDNRNVILRNTLNSSTIRIKKKIKEEIDSAINKRVANDKIKRYMKRIAELEILVPQDLDEKEKYLELFRKHREQDKTFSVYFVTTRDCQLNCPYCFEKGIDRQKKAMTIEIAEKIVVWCREYLKNHDGCNKFRIVLYGGEPLLNKKVIRYILPELYGVAEMRTIDFELGILTNGELLDVKTLFFLNCYNLDKLQITIDGPKEAHDKRRIRKDGTGTFDRIIQNILAGFFRNLIERLDLRINFDRQNVNSIPLLFDFFAKRKLQKKIKLSFGVITPTVSGKTDFYLRDFSFNQKENAENYIWLCREAKKRGFDIPEEYLSGPWCTARKIHSAVIEPDGSLLKCISMVGRKEFIFGDIFSTRETRDIDFENFYYLDKCLSKKCPFVPICGGGCRFEAYNNSGDLSKPYCQREMIEKINKNLLILKFETT